MNRLNRKKFFVIALVSITLIILCLFIIKVQLFPFGYRANAVLPDEKNLEKYLVSSLPNTSIYSYKVDIKIENKDGFIEYLKSNPIRYEIDNFKDKNKNVRWQNVLNEVKEYKIGWKTVYKLKYKTSNPDCNGYKIDMTSDGYILDYRSAGK